MSGFECSRQRGMAVSFSSRSCAYHPCLPVNLGRFPRGTEGAQPTSKTSSKLLRSFPVSERLFPAPCTQVKTTPVSVALGQLLP